MQDVPLTTEDHIWHEIASVSTTTDLPTIPMNTQTLIDRFNSSNENEWNEYDVYEQLGMI